MKTNLEAFFFRFRGLIGYLLLGPVCVVLIFSEPVVPHDGSLYTALTSVGLVLFGLYVTFRIWATLYVGGRKDSELQTEGPYSVTRNPLYFGTFCFVLATACFFKSATLLAFILVGCLYYSRWVIRGEERVLSEMFGDRFHEYCRTTPRFFPSLSRYQAPGAVTVNVKDLRTEAKRLWISFLLPILVEFLMHLRFKPWWPHLFRIP